MIAGGKLMSEAAYRTRSTIVSCYQSLDTNVQKEKMEYLIHALHYGRKSDTTTPHLVAL